MPARLISTIVHLPPGEPSREVVRTLFERVFSKYQWFRPVRCGRFGDEATLVPGSTDYGALVACYDECPRITISGYTEHEYMMLLPSRRAGEFPFTGKLIWTMALSDVQSADWRNAQLLQVAEVMRLLDAPLAWSGVEDDLARKKERFIPNPDGFGTEQTFTLRDPSEGLTGLFWRNFFGPPFIRMFGGRLGLLPPDTHRELGDGLVLVQPYALPTQAMTPEGDAAEQRLITVLGPECFYDHARHRKPTRVPELTAPST